MDEIIWVEVLSRYRDVVARHRCAGGEVRIGRGYANDVIVDDPYVAVEHVRILRDETGALIAEDIGSANGLFADRGTARLERVVLDGDRPIRIGQTYLRIRDAAHPVAREREPKPQARSWPIALALGAAILAIEVISVWLTDITEPKLFRYLLPPLVVSVFALVWTAAWAVMSRIFSGQARFERNLRIALTGMLVFSLYNEWVGFASFALSWHTLAAYRYVVLWSILAAVCFFQVRAISPSRLKLKGAVVAVLLGIAVAMQTLMQSEARTNLDPQNYARPLMPPALRITPLQDESAFFAGVERLQGKLDRDRIDEPTARLFGAED